MYQERSYRSLINSENLISFEVLVKDTDLCIHAKRPLENEARESVLKYRGHIESYIETYPQFFKTLAPWNIKGPVPQIIRDMSNAGIDAGVGPMAAVAGAVSEYVGRDLLNYSDEIIVENGGDIFVKLDRPFTSAIYAGESSLSLHIGILLNYAGQSVAVCTSSATIGHSFSRGAADAVCVISTSCATADAAATSICNQVGSARQIQQSVDFGKQIKGVLGIVVIVGDKIGLWGNLEIVPMG